MKSKIQPQGKLKHALIGFLLLFLLFFVLRSSFSTAGEPRPATADSQQQNGTAPPPSCAKIPPSLAQTIIHYAATNETPQQTLKEMSVTARVLERRSPCNFLVFGLGRDSLMWSALNHGGRTVFLEEDESWIAAVRRTAPSLESYHVVYTTKLHQADALLQSATAAAAPACAALAGDMRSSRCPLALAGLPDAVTGTEWDMIMVDAPTGYFAGAPGRMSAIYTAGMMARRRKKAGETDVFVHDVDRPVEDKFSWTFLCEGYLRQQEGRLRHFTIPSSLRAQGDIATPFCPST